MSDAATSSLQQLASSSATDVRGLQVKLSYLGTQKKSVPSIALSTIHHLVDMDQFTHRYPNDETVLLNFTTTPENLLAFVDGLASASGDFGPDGRDPDQVLSVELALDQSRIGSFGLELGLDRAHGVVVHDLAARTLGPGNDVAALVLGLQAGALGGAGS